MALEKSTVSLNIATSINQKVDDKQIDPSQMAISKNVRVRKDKKVQKREGLQDFSTTQESLNPSNPITIGASNSQSWTAEYQDQLLMQNKGALYVRNQSTSAWKQVGYAAQIRMESEPVATSSYTAKDCDGVQAFGCDVFAFRSSQTVYYSVRRISDGIWLKRDEVLYTGVAPRAVRVLAMSDRVAIVFIDQNIRAATLNSSTFVASSVSNLVTAGATYRSFDAVVSVTAAGEAIVLGYFTNASPSALRMNVFGPNLVALAPGEYNTGLTAAVTGGLNPAINVYIDSSQPNDVFVGFSANSADTGAGTFQLDVRWVAYTIGAASWSVKNAVQTIKNYNGDLEDGGLTPRESGLLVPGFCLSITQITDATNSNNILLFWDRQVFANNANLFLDSTEVFDFDNSITAEIHSFIGSKLGAVVTADAIYTFGSLIAAKATTDTERTTNLLPATVIRNNDRLLVIYDYFRGQEPGKCSIAAVLDGGGIAKYFNPSTTLPQTSLIGDTFQLYTNYFSRGLSGDDDAELGVLLVTGNFEATRSELIESNKALNWSAGTARSFDGINIGELGFLSSPLKTNFTAGTGIRVVTNVVGDATTRQERTIYFPSGAGISTTAGAGSAHAVFISSASQDYAVTFALDGASASLIAGRTNIVINVSSSDTPREIAQKFIWAFQKDTLFVLNGVTDTDYDYGVRVRNQNVGAVTADSLNDINNSTVGSTLSVGTYQAAAVSVYIDRYGNVYRSAPSRISTFPVTALTSLFSCLIICPPVTSREFTLNYIEVYISDADGSILYRLRRPAAGFSNFTWSGTTDRYFADLNFGSASLSGLSLADYLDNPQLYTTGGVLENDYPQNWRFATRYKNRVIIGGFAANDKRLLISKSTFQNEGLSFSEFSEIIVDTDDDEVTAIGNVDDKLIVFKDQVKYVIVGDPPNDAGGASSLSLPSLISSDTGCNDHRSVVQSSDGLYYKSAKGIYRLGRDLQDKYIGDRVEDLNDFTISSAVLFKNTNEIVYFFSDYSEAAVYNYYFDLWTTWTNHQCVDAFYGTKLYVIRENGRVLSSTPTVFKDVENSVTSGVAYSLELPWLKIKGQQDYQRVKQAMLLGELKTAHSMQAEIWWDYDKRDAVKQTLTIASSSIISGTDYADQTYQASFSPMKQKCESIKYRFTDVPDLSTSGESCTLNAVDFYVGLKKGLSKLKAGKQV